MVTSPPLISTAISQGAGRTQPPTRTSSDLRPDLYAVIDPIIKSVVGDDEDAYQDTWVKVLDHKASTEEQILALARSCKRSLRNQAISASYRNISLSKPLGQSDASTPLTLESVLAAPEELSIADLLTIEAAKDHRPPQKHQAGGQMRPLW